MCMYVGTEKVVDVYATQPHLHDPMFVKGEKYDGETVAIHYSAGKSIAAVAWGILATRGLIDYDEKIATYWPEFAKNDKGHITIKELMQHRAGLQKQSVGNAPLWTDMTEEGIKANKFGERFENEVCHYPNWSENAPNSKSAYHSIHRDSIMAEICRRVDPEKRTAHEFFEQELGIPLAPDGKQQVYMGFNGDPKQIANIRWYTNEMTSAMFCPKSCGRKFPYSISEIGKMYAKYEWNEAGDPHRGDEFAEFDLMGPNYARDLPIYQEAFHSLRYM